MQRNPTMSEILAGIGMLVWIIGFLALPWYSAQLSGIVDTRVDTLSGPDAGGVRWLFFLFAVAIIVFVALGLTSIDVSGSIDGGLIVLVGGGVMTLFTIVFAFVLQPELEAGPVSIEIGPSWGLFISLAGSLLTVYGGFAMLNDETPTVTRRGRADARQGPAGGYMPQPGYPQQPQPDRPTTYPETQTAYPPQQPPSGPEQPQHAAEYPGYPPWQQPPGYPPEQGAGYPQPPQQQQYPSQPPEYPAQTPTYPTQPDPGHWPQDSVYPPRQPEYHPPPAEQPPYSYGQEQGYAQQPRHDPQPQTPGYPAQQPENPPQQPGYAPEPQTDDVPPRRPDGDEDARD